MKLIKGHLLQIYRKCIGVQVFVLVGLAISQVGIIWYLIFIGLDIDFKGIYLLSTC
jgi:hypothetical protein